MKQTCILILGMHRSGTSAFSGVLSLLDVYLGRSLMKPTPENPKGYFENAPLYEINKSLLSQMGSSWADIFYTEARLKKPINIDPLKAMIRSEFGCSQVFAIKDPRLAYLFPLYRQVLDEMDIEIKVVLPFRHPLEVAGSLTQRNGFSREQGMLLWAYHYLLAEKHSRPYPRVVISFEELVSDPEEVVGRISDRVGIDFLNKYDKAKNQIVQFIEPDLKHHNASIDDLSEIKFKVVKEILALGGDFDSQEAMERLDELREELFGYQELFYNGDVVATYAALQTKENELARSQKTLAAQTAQKEALSNKLKLLHNSRSWRYTRPIRKIIKKFGGALKKIRRC